VNRIFALFFLLVMSLSASALTDGQVMYAGGTVPGLGVNTIGRLDTASDTALTFESVGSKLAIPYSAIESFEYSQEVTRHLGVLPAIAVGLVKQCQPRHFFRITYHDQAHVSQTAISEVPKTMPRTLQAVLNARGPAGLQVLLKVRARKLSMQPSARGTFTLGG
jgi:hypothetical protein